jgi:putative salt-induced outer membrane protein YdiY
MQLNEIKEHNRALMPSLKPSRRVFRLFLTFAFLTVAWADQIVLKDGDRITGAIVKKDGQTVTMQSKNFGLVKLKWEDIETIRTDQPLNVVLPDDRTVKANIQTQDDRIQVAGADAPQTVAPSDIVALRNDAEQRAYERLQRPGISDLWTITGSLNIAGAEGNAETSTFTTPVNFVRASKTSRTTAYFFSVRSTATVNGVSAKTAQAVRGGWSFSRNLTPKILANLFNDYDYDQFQALDLRVVLGGGLGYQIWTAETGRFVFVAGAAWNREKFGPADAAAFTRHSAEAYWGDDLNYKLNSRTTLVQAFRMFNNLSNVGPYRINFDIGARTQLTKWLTWNIALSDRYLSNPIAGRKKNDLLYTTGLGFSLAR